MKTFAIIFRILPYKSATFYDVQKMMYGDLNLDKLEFTEERKPRRKNLETYLSIRNERDLFDEFEAGAKKVCFFGFPITKIELLEKYPGLSLEQAKKQYYEDVTSLIYLGNFDYSNGERYYRAVDGRTTEFMKIDFMKPLDIKKLQKQKEEIEQKTKKYKK